VVCTGGSYGRVRPRIIVHVPWCWHTLFLTAPLDSCSFFPSVGLCLDRSLGCFSIGWLGYFSIYVLFIPGAKAVGNGCSFEDGPSLLSWGYHPGFLPSGLGFPPKYAPLSPTTAGRALSCDLRPGPLVSPHLFLPRSSPPWLHGCSGAGSMPAVLETAGRRSLADQDMRVKTTHNKKSWRGSGTGSVIWLERTVQLNK